MRALFFPPTTVLADEPGSPHVCHDETPFPPPAADATREESRRRRLYTAGLMQFLSAYSPSADSVPSTES
ncbi:hypothetical protein DB347_19560 [Opitutaceae bacterium EW11]|nr:hypothetical protein DB347_19560 [Opitutaceae bacterium EW11]